MEGIGLNKIVDSLGNALSVFDFSFFVSGAVTLGFIALDLHYYGHNEILQLQGWTSVLIYILAIYVCGLMSWSIGKVMRWCVLRLLWGKDGIRKDFYERYVKVAENSTSVQKEKRKSNGQDDRFFDVEYPTIWVVIGGRPDLADRFSSLNKMWVMVAVFEGLAFSWLVGILVYMDGWLVGKWIKTESILYNIVPLLVLVGLIVACLHRATRYSQDLIKDVVSTYNYVINSKDNGNK